MAKEVYKSIHGEKIIKELVIDIYDSFTEYKLHKIDINTTAGKTTILKTGQPDKPVLLMLHGTMSNSATWFGSLKYFINDFCIYLIDIPGEPGLSEPRRIPLNSEIPQNWLLEIFDNLEIKNASIVSMSLGSWYSLNFATLHPHRVSTLAIISTSGIVPPKVSFIFKALFFMMLGSKGLKLINNAIYYKTPQIKDDKFIKYQQNLNKYFNPVVEPIPILSNKRLKTISFPIQYFGGDHDVLLNTFKTAKRMKKLIPNIEIHILKETGHVIIDQFEKISCFIKTHV
ncbi:alpha/beta fold hydrolase [Sulfurospirillum arcachonense]|uniref:alpha/beta fold hydrolase n=1 Tax=Sulfurospirillum arcachonense TaxID=57666 RepID=UPI0004698447|nr:alpha/beta hydrolase [Sulfurospirillum arcachonense]